MYTKIESSINSLDPSAGESYADLLLEMGKDLSGNNQFDIGLKWLERAYDVLGAQDLDRLSSDAGELRLSIIQSLGQSAHST